MLRLPGSHSLLTCDHAMLQNPHLSSLFICATSWDHASRDKNSAQTWDAIMMLCRWGHACPLIQLVLISETFSIKRLAFKSEAINLDGYESLLMASQGHLNTRTLQTAGEWEKWGGTCCLVPKGFSRHLLLAIARDKIWLVLDLYSALKWLFLRPKMRTDLALHLKINESSTERKRWNEKWLLGQKLNWTFQHNQIQIVFISRNQQKGKLTQGLIIHSLHPLLFSFTFSLCPSQTQLYINCAIMWNLMGSET